MDIRREIRRILSEADGGEPTVKYRGAWDPSDTSGGAEKGKGYTYTEWSDGKVTKARVKSFVPILFGGKVDHDSDKSTPDIDVPFSVEAVAVLDGFPPGLETQVIPSDKRGLADKALEWNGGVRAMRPDLYGNPLMQVQPASGGGVASGSASASTGVAPDTAQAAPAPSPASPAASPSGKTPTINLENKGGSTIAAYVFLMKKEDVDKLKISSEINVGFKASDSAKYEVAGLVFAGGISAIPGKKESKRIDELENASKMTPDHVAYIVNVTSGEIESDGYFQPKKFLGYAAGYLRAAK